jgi:translation initiation factor IF-1
LFASVENEGYNVTVKDGISLLTGDIVKTEFWGVKDSKSTMMDLEVWKIIYE